MKNALCQPFSAPAEVAAPSERSPQPLSAALPLTVRRVERGQREPGGGAPDPPHQGHGGPAPDLLPGHSQ